MNHVTSMRALHRFACLVGLVALTAGCDPSSPLYGGLSGSDSGSGSGGVPPDPDAWIAMGQGEMGWSPVEDGDELWMVLGGQGLLMFPMPLRGSGFTLADDPSDYTDPATPLFDMYLDIEGFELDFGGHFKRLANYPVPFEILDDGTYEFIYITLFVPDELLDPCDIDGLEGFLHAELDVVDGYTLTWDRNVVMRVPADLCNAP